MVDRSPLPSRQQILAVAQRILDARPDPVIHYRILRDVLLRSASDPELRAARARLRSSPQVQSLAAEQLRDGSWGRLHSADTRARRRIGTTEAGVEAGLTFGLTADDRPLRAAAAHLVSVLEGRVTVRDPPEHNDLWSTGVALFAAATLARLRPDSPALDCVARRWVEIVRRVFARGAFDAQAETEAHRDLHGIHDGVGYLSLRSRYAVRLLGARASQVPKRIRDAYALWLSNHPKGLGYLDVPCWPPPRLTTRSQLIRWLTTLQLLCSFDAAHQQLSRAVHWLWDQCADDGLWDFGAAATGLRLSPARTSARRAHDHSLRPLILATQLTR